MLTRNVSVVKEIPGEPGETMTFRQLSWRKLVEATEAKAIDGLRRFKTVPEVLTAIQNANTNRNDVQQAAAAQVAVDPLAQYDVATVLHYGVVSWTYPDKLNADALDSLDQDTAMWAANEIIALGKPPSEPEMEDRFFGSPDSSMATPATATVAVGAAMAPQTNGSSRSSAKSSQSPPQ